MRICKLVCSSQALIHGAFYSLDLLKNVLFNLLLECAFSQSHAFLHSFVHFGMLNALIHLHLTQISEFGLDFYHTFNSWPCNFFNDFSSFFLRPIVIHQWLFDIIKLHFFLETGATGFEGLNCAAKNFHVLSRGDRFFGEVWHLLVEMLQFLIKYCYLRLHFLN